MDKGIETKLNQLYLKKTTMKAPSFSEEIFKKVVLDYDVYIAGKKMLNKN